LFGSKKQALKGREMTPGSVLARPLAAAGLAMLCTQTASATLHQWDWSPGTGGASSFSEIGGAVHSIGASFNDASRRLAFSVSFSDRITEGFYLVLTDGEAPVGHAGKYGIFYFDAYDVFDSDPSTNVQLTSYSYNGRNNHSSWRDGDPALAGDQSPDCIKPLLDSSWIINAYAADATLPGGLEGRVMGFEIDSTDILAHLPLYPGSQSWRGTGFGDLIGVKIVPAQVYETDYRVNGEIDWLGTENEGGFEGTFRTLLVPTPSGSLALAAAGIFLGLRRSRRPARPGSAD
jgi:hypothetical protein